MKIQIIKKEGSSKIYEVEKVKYFSIEEIEEIRSRMDMNYTFCKWNDEGFAIQLDYAILW